VYSVHDWAEVHRLHHVEGMGKAAIAAKLGMSRTTVHRLLGLSEPPRYQRRRAGSKLDPFCDAIAAMLREDPKVPATVIAPRLRRQGFTGSLTILKEHLRGVRPAFVAAAAYQRTSYLPGELAQVDWWHTGLAVPVGKGRAREAFGLVATLPASAAVRVVFTLARTTAEYCAALLGCLERLGGLPEAVVSDNDAGIVASRRGGVVRLVSEVAALYGALGLRPVVLRPRFPRARAPGNARSATWRPRFCRCARRLTWPSCRPKPTSGRSRWPTLASSAGWEPGSPTRSPSSGPACAGCPSAGRTSTAGWRCGPDATGLCGWPAWTTRCRHGWPAAGLGCGCH
jgi:transposase